jgi:hypothetical protein
LTFIVFKKSKKIFSAANVVLKLKMSRRKFKLSGGKTTFQKDRGADESAEQVFRQHIKRA